MFGRNCIKRNFRGQKTKGFFFRNPVLGIRGGGRNPKDPYTVTNFKPVIYKGVGGFVGLGILPPIGR